MYLLAVNAGLRTVELSRANVKDLEVKAGSAYLYIWGKGHSEADQKMLEEILPGLQKKYTFRAGDVVLEPFATLAEVIQEGSQQSICIGGYAKRYAAGGTILCKMRHASAPDVPWHAVEFDKTGRMVQCRGYKNHTWAEDEKEEK